MNTTPTTTRAERLIEFHEMTGPVLRLALVTFVIAFVTFIATAHRDFTTDTCRAAFLVTMASLGALVAFGLPWLAGRGYKSMANERIALERAQALRLRGAMLARHRRN